MSGHSKWSTIKRKKEKTDGARAKVFTKIGRELAVAVKQGGPDPSSNSKLKDVIAKAKAANIPNDNIDRAIKKAAGNSEADSYESIVYEGYGPNGIAIIVETLTDNRNRTAGAVRHYFDKYGGNMGQSGCVSFMFERKGQIIIDREEYEGSGDDLMEIALEAGAEDLKEEEDSFEIVTSPEDFDAVREALDAAGIPMAEAEIAMIPLNTVSVTDEQMVKNLRRTLDLLDEDDDVQAVYHNWDE